MTRSAEVADACVLWARTQTVWDWSINVWCACGMWARSDAYDWPTVYDAHDEHMQEKRERRADV